MNKSLTNYDIVIDKISIEKYNSFCYFNHICRNYTDSVNDMELIYAIPKIINKKDWPEINVESFNHSS